jgi:peroxiredoxin Q/BCP
MADMPSAGQEAPDFTFTDRSGESRKLSDFRGQWAAVYFYPKDDTPGCTKQACNLRDNYAKLQDEGVAVIGISGDDEASHERFADKYDLPFPLVPDTDHAIMEDYGAWGEKNFYGKKIVGVKRTTFLIDPEGTIRHVFRRPKTGEHAEEVLARRDRLVEA